MAYGIDIWTIHKSKVVLLTTKSDVPVKVLEYAKEQGSLIANDHVICMTWSDAIFRGSVMADLLGYTLVADEVLP